MNKKLIEVALPLQAINLESAREKSIRHGHPSTLHLWWARRPLATCRAVLFASLVDDPSSHPELFPTLEAQDAERQRLFRIIEQLVKWESSNNEQVLSEARAEIMRSTNGNPPPVLDPFCGGGSIPLEAQRLGLEAHASDLNPVAVLITKALIEIPPKFANRPPVNPTPTLTPPSAPLSQPGRGDGDEGGYWNGAAGLAEDVRYYGKWMRDEAEKRIGHLYPKVRLPREQGGGEATVIAWLWARTVKCPNPACGAQMPLVRSFMLSTKKGREAWVEPVVTTSPPAPLLQEERGESATEPDRWEIPEAVHRRMVEVAREFRKQPTRSESELWEALRDRRLEGAKFRRQQPIGPFVVDFYAPSHRLIVEVDGPIHALQQPQDQQRQQLLESLGLQVLRVAAADVEHNLPGVRDTIRHALHEPSPPTPLPIWERGAEGGVRVDPEGPGVRVRFEVRHGVPPADKLEAAKGGTQAGRGATFRCVACGQIADQKAVRAQFQAKRSGEQMMAIVAEGQRGRIYLAPDTKQVDIAVSAEPNWKPEEEMNQDTTNLVSGRGYGITRWHEIFTPRQLVALTTFSDLVEEAREKVLEDALTPPSAPLSQIGRGDGGEGDRIPLDEGGTGAQAYADAVATYLAMGVDRVANTLCTVARWTASREQTVTAFSRQAIPMTWDFPDVNPFAGAAGDIGVSIESISDALVSLPARPIGTVRQLDATASINGVSRPLVSTDPPYYDNIGYADLADFFYVWLRRSLGSVYPQLFSTVLVPKAQELVATPYRFGGSRQKAQAFFERGLGEAFDRMREKQHPAYPLTVYYAFKQSEDASLTPPSAPLSGGSLTPPSAPLSQTGRGAGGEGLRASTGWETMLEGLLRAGFQITGTWPMRSELGNRMVASGTNALASSIVLVCRPRPENAPLTTRRDFLNTLKRELPDALVKLQHGNVAPVDLPQATIGPGMAVYSRYSKVVESDGSRMSVRTALGLINQALDEVLTEQEGEYDSDTRWAISWFEQHGHNDGSFGDADNMSRARNTSVGGLREAGLIEARGGKVRLLRREELPDAWDPGRDTRLTVWETTQQMIRALDTHGEEGAAAILRRVSAYGDAARDLAYRLYLVCERKGWAQEALAYNGLVIAWPSIVARSYESRPEQSALL